jgi:hypothetical protein
MEYGRTFDRGVDAYQRILELANPMQRPRLENYLQGYIYWHLASGRYHWDEFVALAR